MNMMLATTDGALLMALRRPLFATGRPVGNMEDVEMNRITRTGTIFGRANSRCISDMATDWRRRVREGQGLLRRPTVPGYHKMVGVEVRMQIMKGMGR